MNKLKSFLWYCSGADRELLDECPPAEREKFLRLGLMVGMVATVSAAMMAYGLHIMFYHAAITLASALMYWLLVLMMGISVISSVKKTDSSFKTTFVVLIHGGAACALAFLVSMPVELKVFEKQIDTYLAGQRAAIMMQYNRQIPGSDTSNAATMKQSSAQVQQVPALPEDQRKKSEQDYAADRERLLRSLEANNTLPARIEALKAISSEQVLVQRVWLALFLVLAGIHLMALTMKLLISAPEYELRLLLRDRQLQAKLQRYQRLNSEFLNSVYYKMLLAQLIRQQYRLEQMSENSADRYMEYLRQLMKDQRQFSSGLKRNSTVPASKQLRIKWIKTLSQSIELFYMATERSFTAFVRLLKPK